VTLGLGGAIKSPTQSNREIKLRGYCFFDCRTCTRMDCQQRAFPPL